MTFNTGNPVGSTDARDLYDNAQNFDKLSVGPEPSYPDRLGVPRKSWAGMEAQVTEALSRLGYQVKGDYAAGLLIENYGEVFRKDGEFWRASADLELPYELTGDWGVEEALFVSVGDAALRYDLGNPPTGAGLVGYSVAEDYPAGSIASAVQRRNLEYYAAQMAAGEAVKIACFGDSTTDGNNTTGWTANPVREDGSPVGTTDHAMTAPNAWPAVLQRILREMYSNTDISIWNAGYSGRRLDDGWALQYYDSAVTNNPEYGVPDVCFIAFGINDITGAGSQLDDTIRQTRLLVQKILDAGTLPVLLTSDPIAPRSGRLGTELSREIDQAKRSIGSQYGVPVLEVGQALKDWLSVNNDNMRWMQQQTDGIHFGDYGHSLKAQYIASRIFNDTVLIDSGSPQRLSISAWDSRSNCPAYVNAQRSFNSYVRQGAHPYYSPNGSVVTQPGEPGLTLWVWNESPATELVYRGIFNEGFTGDISSAPRVRVVEQFASTAQDKIPLSVGFTGGNAYRASDMPFRFGKLRYGLSRIEYKTAGVLGQFFNNFEFWQSRQTKNSDVVAAVGGLGSTRFEFAAGAARAILLPDMIDGSNSYGLFTGETLEMRMNVTIPRFTGIVLAWNQKYGDADDTYGSRTIMVAYRDSQDRITLYSAALNSDLTMKTISSFGRSAPLTWSSDTNDLRFTMSRSGNNCIMKLYAGDLSANPVLDLSKSKSEQPGMFAAVVGGAYAYHDTAAVVEINQLYISTTGA